MKKLLCLVLCLTAFLASTLCFADGDLKITPSMLQFTYQTSDGSVSQDCTEILADAASQDWNVTCGAKKYIVHLWVTVYDRPVLPKQSYEILYWVTDLSASPSQQGAQQAESTTVWFHFREPSDLYQLQVSLGLENDSAELQLVIDPSKV
jgi:hypothetical protein